MCGGGEEVSIKSEMNGILNYHVCKEEKAGLYEFLSFFYEIKQRSSLYISDKTIFLTWIYKEKQPSHVASVSCSQGWPQTPYVNQDNTETLTPWSSPPEGITSMRHKA